MFGGKMEGHCLVGGWRMEGPGSKFLPKFFSSIPAYLFCEMGRSGAIHFPCHSWLSSL